MPVFLEYVLLLYSRPRCAPWVPIRTCKGKETNCFPDDHCDMYFSCVSNGALGVAAVGWIWLAGGD